MAGTGSAAQTTHGTDGPHHPFRTGWTAFAAVLMIFGGAMAIFQGISAIAKDDVFVATRNYVFQFNLTGWGWIHLILGIVIVIAGCALFTGALWARVIGVLLAGLGALANFAWLPHYPLWSIVLIAIDVFIIWALCTGGDSRART
ncbi:hypothetical protein K388_02911 [Streptomyces sp. KhCrAH-43]|uniref:DUF7144 family membrane protein n=1 Tax=unclassified Streptomyces TaxID=2593676 RepID=UPI000375C133|nr:MULTISPECIES: hypothetical protein [unclassified Streptomyces]MYS36903.1 hypothetical protein [Streptomyces sp. SID4920]MYX69374.1 hypothetical protein [Streptomyces sp. SID8373]RAJ62225.1 hypothetical protein K388_02911 [Streptomyces sp. KhCrAH-43]